MTTVTHASLTGADLHEPKGTATALSGQVYVANGSGSGVWTAASSIITNQAFTTGDAKLTYKTVADATWILCDDGTIGDGSSGGTTRANADTAALFTLLWNLPVSLTVSGGRGASAAVDYAAHKTIQLPKTLGRSLMIAGAGAGLTSRQLANIFGVETVVLSTANLPPYTPSGSVSTTINTAVQQFNSNVGVAASAGFTVPSSASIAPGLTSTFTGNAQGGTSTAFNVVNPSAFINIMIKL